MSWGNKLLIAFIAFGCMIGYMVYKAVETPTNLVSDEYYKDELKFQDRIDASNNAKKLDSVQVVQNGGTVSITLPAAMKGTSITGEAYFYSKTDPNKDKRLTLSTDSLSTSFNKDELPRGNLLLKLSWQSGNENYYVEKQIDL